MKKYFTLELLKKIGRILYDDVIYPVAKAYVEKTTNKYDDQALEFLTDLADEHLAPKKAKKDA